MKLVKVEGVDRIVNLDRVQAAHYYLPGEVNDCSELILYLGGRDGEGDPETEAFFGEAADALWDYLCRAAEPIALIHVVPPGEGRQPRATHTSPSPAGASTAHEA